ncbi:hypothetical protein ACFFX0_29845 [Citricoccus parietis]|uniref:Uncharacterized protein n=1 Tax=Citricoccus parietis TaxID=592307 RepID=A0ABV5G570_9MICC
MACRKRGWSAAGFREDSEVGSAALSALWALSAARSGRDPSPAPVDAGPDDFSAAAFIRSSAAEDDDSAFTHHLSPSAAGWRRSPQ